MLISVSKNNKCNSLNSWQSILQLLVLPQHTVKGEHQVLIYRRRRCQEEAPRDQPAPERSRTCWHSWVWPGAGWSADSPSSRGGAAQWCHCLTAPRAWAPVPPPPVDKMSPIPAPLADLEGDVVRGHDWKTKRRNKTVITKQKSFVSLWRHPKKILLSFLIATITP